MVEQPYTVCRPVTTCRQEVVESAAITSGSTPTVPGPVVERQVQVPVEDCGCEPARLFGCLHHKKKVTATVAVQCPPRTVSQRVFVSRPVVRDVSETRYVRETMVRQVPVQTCRMVAEERVETIPVTTCQYVAEERVEPYEVRTCQMVAEERVETIPVTTCQYRRRGAGRALRGPDLRDGRRGAGRDHPRHHLPVRRRGAGRALRGPDLPDGGRGAGRDDPRDDLPVCRRGATSRRVPVTTCRMVAETASRQVPVCVPEQVPVTVNRCVARVVPRTDRRAAVHDGPGGRPDLPVLQLTGGIEQSDDQDEGEALKIPRPRLLSRANRSDEERRVWPARRFKSPGRDRAS